MGLTGEPMAVPSTPTSTQYEEALHPEGTFPDDIMVQVQIQDLGVDQTLG